MCDHEDLSKALVTCVLVLSVLCTIIILCINNDWKTAAIKHNAAQYSPTTGAFEWLPVTTTNEEINNEE